MVERLYIEQEVRLSTEEYARLGNIIVRSVHLRELDLLLPLTDGAVEFVDGIANTINLQKLNFKDDYSPQNTRAELSMGGNSPLIRLLQNPQNQLKKCSLSRLGLIDQDLIAISQVLPTCQIEVFDVSDNLIESDGMLEFARQLPRMHSLKLVRCGSNRWEKSEIACKTFGAALLQGIMENNSLESMDRAGLNAIPQVLLVWHYLVLNRAGRRLFASSQTIPDGLWPLVLKRAGRAQNCISHKMYRFRIEIERKMYPWKKSIERNPSYDAVYFVLQNCPAVQSLRCDCIQGITQRARNNDLLRSILDSSPTTRNQSSRR